MVSSQVRDWVVATSILFTLSSIAVALRVLAVRVRGTSFRPAEYFVFLAFACQLGYLLEVSIVGTLALSVLSVSWRTI